MSKQSPSSDEIDLLDLLIRFYDVIRRNLILAITLPLLGALVGFLMAEPASTSYFGRMMLKIDVLNDIESSFIMQELKQSDTINILVENHYNSMEYEIEKGEESSVYLTIQVQSNEVETFPQFKDAIIQVLNSNELFVRKRKYMEFYYNELLKRTEQELEALDKVKSQIDYSSKIAMTNPNDLFISGVELAEKKMDFMLKLEGIKNITVVKSFDPAPAVKERSRLKYTLAGFVAGGIIFLGILFVKFFVGHYRKYRLSQLS